LDTSYFIVKQADLHLVRKLEKCARFSCGPLMDKVFKIGLTLSVSFGEGYETLPFSKITPGQLISH